MAGRKPYSGQRKLVLAFDVGTTFSGISYSILQPGQIPETHGVTKFPGQEEGRGNAKVPSILYYDDHGNVKSAGSEALDMDMINTAMDNGWTKAEWWKLHLRPKHLSSAHIKDEDLPALPPGKSAVDVLTDFIKYLYTCAKRYIEERHIGFNWASVENSIEYVFTHPNGWEGRQQKMYREAIEQAGLVPATLAGQSRVHMLTEGEASLHYCVSSLPSTPSGTEGVVIIDAGGGTIDLSMYSLTFNPTACKETAPAECRLQGAVFVTNRAKALLQRKLKGSAHDNDDEIAVLTREFDQTTKLAIRSADEAVYLKVGNLRYNNPQFNIKRGALTLSGEEATKLFEESIRAITDAFEQQRKTCKTKITMAFLVGGLGTNKYVWTRLQSYFGAQGIKISRPDNDINKAVANGALLFHIDQGDHLVKSLIARATYGVPMEPWVNTSNPEHNRRKSQWKSHISGSNVITGGFDPVLRKGEQIDEKKELRRPFTTSRDNPAGFDGHGVDINCYRGALSDPRWVDEDPCKFLFVAHALILKQAHFSHLCTIRADLRPAAVRKTTASGSVFYQASFEVVAVFGRELTAQVAYKINGNEQRSPATIAYYDD